MIQGFAMRTNLTKSYDRYKKIMNTINFVLTHKCFEISDSYIFWYQIVLNSKYLALLCIDFDSKGFVIQLHTWFAKCHSTK